PHHRSSPLAFAGLLAASRVVDRCTETSTWPYLTTSLIIGLMPILNFSGDSPEIVSAARVKIGRVRLDVVSRRRTLTGTSAHIANPVAAGRQGMPRTPGFGKCET